MREGAARVAEAQPTNATRGGGTPAAVELGQGAPPFRSAPVPVYPVPERPRAGLPRPAPAAG